MKPTKDQAKFVATSHSGDSTYTAKPKLSFAEGTELDWPQERLFRVLLVASVSVGVLFRLVHYLSNRSLWLDEALLAHNLCGRGFANLTSPLDLDQAAPLGYLWLTKACIYLVGCNEYGLRLVSLLAGLAVLPLTFLVCRRHFGARAAVLATAVTAVAPSFVYFSAEVKQYSLDIAVALLIAHVAGRFAAAPRSLRQVVELAATGVLSVWMSHPAVFVLAAVGVWLLAVTPLRSDPQVRRLAVLIAGLWITSFTINYFLFLRSLGGNTFFTTTLQHAFLRVPPRAGADLHQYVSVVIGAFETLFTPRAPADFTGVRVSMAAAGLWVAGIVWMWRDNRRSLLLFLLPFGLLLASAAFGKYPARDRHILFSLPFFVMPMGHTLAGLTNQPESRVRTFGWIGFLAIVLLPSLYGLQSLVRPPAREEVRPAMQYLTRQWQPGDEMYVPYETAKVFEYYRRYAGVLAMADRVTRGAAPITDMRTLEKDLDRLTGRRVWVLFSHTRPEEEAVVLTLLHQRGELREEVGFEGAKVFLFDMTSSRSDHYILSEGDSASASSPKQRNRKAKQVQP